MRRSVVIVLGVLVAAMLPLAALADQSYDDPSGDSGTAPDIVGVTVTHDFDNAIRFAIRLADGVELSKTGELALLVDTDLDDATGTEEGAEVEIDFFGDSRRWGYGRWDGTKLASADGVRASELSFGPGEVVIELAHSWLNSSQRFAFWVYSGGYQADALVAADSAPDGVDVYTYSVVPKPVTLKGGKPSPTPRIPVAGRKFAVSMTVTRKEDGAAVPRGKVQCLARIGKKRVPGNGAVLNGILPRCTFKIPPKTSGKVIRGLIAVSTPNGSVTRPFAFKIF